LALDPAPAGCLGSAPSANSSPMEMPVTEIPRTARGLAYAITDLTPPWSRASRPVVFHHGIGTNRDVWSGWLPAFAGSRRCVRFDTRGYGQSVVPPKDHKWTMDEMLDDLM